MSVRQADARPRSAFTLVELLVVISIIGVLMSLLLPAVQAARNAQWKMACGSNLKNLSTATTAWTTAKNGRLPGYSEQVGPYRSTAPLSNRGTWGIALLNYLDQTPIYDTLRSNGIAPVPTTSLPRIEIYLCPADGVKSSEDGGPMSYVGNIGKAGTLPDGTLYSVAMMKANGVFQNFEPALPAHAKVSFKLTDVADGTAQTILHSESIQEGVTWGLPTAPGVATNEQHFKMAAGFHWFDPDDDASYPTPEMMINSPLPGQIVQPYADPQVARPSSYHPGGVNMSFLDGHVQFIPETIDYVTYMQLMTPDSEASDMPILAKPFIVDWSKIN